MSRPFATEPSTEAVTPEVVVRDADVRDGAGNPMLSPFIPLLILSLVFVAWFTFQATQLRIEGDVMRELTTKQDKQVQDSTKLRESLEAIARGTARLADGGNANARLIVDELKRRGVTIAPDGSATGLDAGSAK